MFFVCFFMFLFSDKNVFLKCFFSILKSLFFYIYGTNAKCGGRGNVAGRVCSFARPFVLVQDDLISCGQTWRKLSRSLQNVGEVIKFCSPSGSATLSFSSPSFPSFSIPFSFLHLPVLPIFVLLLGLSCPFPSSFLSVSSSNAILVFSRLLSLFPRPLLQIQSWPPFLEICALLSVLLLLTELGHKCCW